MERRYTAAEFTRAAGVSYRRLDYWTNIGLLQGCHEPAPGSGRPRTWSEEDVILARLIKRLAEGGVSMTSITRAIQRGHLERFMEELSDLLSSVRVG